MIRETHERIAPLLERRDHGFRWRGKDISRIEGLSDGVFAFAVTLLVVSLEAPKNFQQLEHMMHGFVAFAICFALLLMIWHSQYIYFRRYALDDRTSFLLNAALLFVVAFYVYPLKFLFTIFVNGVLGYQELDLEGKVIAPMRSQDWRSLMVIYDAGFIALYGIFALLYLHAYRMREHLALNPMEVYETRGVVQENVLMMAIGLVSLSLALFINPALAGLAYAAIAPAQAVLGRMHRKARAALSASTTAPSLSA